MKPLDVSFAPYFPHTNPYQGKLVEALQTIQVSVHPIPHGKVYLPQCLKMQKSDILHLHWLHKYSHSHNPLKSFLRVLKFIYGLIRLKKSHTKIVWTAHNIRDHESLFPLSDRICRLVVAKLSDAIIVHSKAAKQEIKKDLMLKGTQKIFVVPHGHYLNCYENTVNQKVAREKLNLPESATVFLFFGLIRSYKGLPELIKAFQQINQKDAYLVIAGNSKDKQLTDWIRSQSMDHRHIRFYPGFVSDDEVQIYMNACDAVVFPYRSLLTSGAMILAMSFGRVCVAPRIGCVSEILNEDISFLYNAAEEDGLFQAMNTVLSQKNRCNAMGVFNLARVQEWDWEKVAKMTLGVYRDCLN